MIDSVTPGTNIIRAMQVVRASHREVARMLIALDEAVLSCGWEPLHGQSWLALTQNGAQLGDPLNWLAGTLHRAYVPLAARGEPKDGPRDQIAIYEVHLEPSSSDEPLVTGLHARLRPTAPRDLWNQWNWAFPAPWRQATKPGMLDVDSSELAAILPAAMPQTIAVYVEALVAIDRMNITERLVTPLLGQGIHRS